MTFELDHKFPTDIYLSTTGECFNFFHRKFIDRLNENSNLAEVKVRKSSEIDEVYIFAADTALAQREITPDLYATCIRGGRTWSAI